MPKRIDSNTSRTAEFTCMVRYLSYLEKRPQYKTYDYVSPVIMNSFMKFITLFPAARRFILNKIPAGMYEYVIARTKYIDEAVNRALSDGTEQILILGAGFDSRGIRFHKTGNSVKVFELDAYATQNAKIERYKEKGIVIPDSLIFVSIDFDKQSVSERLSECGFEKNKKCLIIMEGLTMYLQPESVDSLFKIINDFTGKESRIIFDFIYASVLEYKNLYQGEKELLESTSKAGEKFCFGLNKEDVQGFLSSYGFTVSDIADDAALNKKYFLDGDGKQISSVNGTHCLITAIKD